MNLARVKYPRTHHVPWSQSNSSDDCWWSDCAAFEGREVVCSVKVDGECTTVYPDGHTHARSLDTDRHPSRSWMRAHAASFAYKLPATFRVCGENLFAFHSILYTELPTYFFVFGIYDGDRCLTWTETEEWCMLLGLHAVPVWYRGPWDEATIRAGWDDRCSFPTFETAAAEPRWPDNFRPCGHEGYVVRLADDFRYDEFNRSVAKMVRAGHVRTDQHWMARPVIPNRLAADAQG